MSHAIYGIIKYIKIVFYFYFGYYLIFLLINNLQYDLIHFVYITTIAQSIENKVYIFHGRSFQGCIIK